MTDKNLIEYEKIIEKSLLKKNIEDPGWYCDDKYVSYECINCERVYNAVDKYTRRIKQKENYIADEQCTICLCFVCNNCAFDTTKNNRICPACYSVIDEYNSMVRLARLNK